MQQYLCQTQRCRDIQEKGEKTSLEFSVWQYFDQSTQTCDESHRYEAQTTKLKLTFVAQQQKVYSSFAAVATAACCFVCNAFWDTWLSQINTLDALRLFHEYEHQCRR